MGSSHGVADVGDHPDDVRRLIALQSDRHHFRS